MQNRNPVVCDASKVSLHNLPTSDRRADLGIYHNQIFTKMTKLFSLAQETIISGYDQKTITKQSKIK